MKTKLKHLFFLATVAFSITACGSNLTKPTSGFDVSLLPARLLSINPAATDEQPDRSAEQQTIWNEEGKPLDQNTQRQ